ncbi:transmembrane protein 42 isoform X1 [Zootoca vivipara]|uniref:transmembrane protein 42 isoform X1 n=1 Tax=Zootoca vivipara TaxID=8524 RepID=UPI00158FEA68|nr:transmembrane protein 42 isoform X1 [Zootoca vivipara]
MPAGWGAVFAAGAGLLGALAACSAKLALGADYLRGACAAVVGGEEAASGVCSWLPVMLRIGCGGLVLACNAIMWTFFAKALRYSSSSATATLTSTASNFISSVGRSWDRAMGAHSVAGIRTINLLIGNPKTTDHLPFLLTRLTAVQLAP